MTVFKNDGGVSSVVVVKAEETYQTPLLPGFILSLSQLFKMANDWAVAKTRPSRPE